jgi:hypothetical protein
MNFSLPVAAADNADLAISKGWEVNTYSFIPSGEAANTCDAKPTTAHAPIANFASSRWTLTSSLLPLQFRS